MFGGGGGHGPFRETAAGLVGAEAAGRPRLRGAVVGRGGTGGGGAAGDPRGEGAEHHPGPQQRLGFRGIVGHPERRQFGDPQEFRLLHDALTNRDWGERPSIVGGVPKEAPAKPALRRSPGRSPALPVSRILALIPALIPALAGAGIAAGCGAADPPSPPSESFVFPAEFEPHRALWMAWPTYENQRGRPTEPLLIEIIRAAEGRVAIELLAQDGAEAAEIRARLAREAVPAGHVTIRSVPHGDIWMRDMGPIFLRGDRGGMKVADFGFNMWGYESPDSPNSLLEGAVDRRVAALLGLEVVRSPLISEGGSREFNGRGVMLAVEAVERQRNPDWTLEAMEAEFRRVLGVTKVVWLAEGMAEDELTFRGQLPGGVYTVITTGGHVDEFARFADPETILLAEVSDEERRADPIAAISHRRLEESFRRLRAATDAEGNPFRIVRVPVPDSLFETMRRGDGVFDYIQPLAYEDGSSIAPDDEVRVIAAASYLNFQVTNGLVLAQKYWKPGMPESLREKDERALAILREVFPGREVVALDAMAVNLGGGGIHCVLQQEPLPEPLPVTPGS